MAEYQWNYIDKIYEKSIGLVVFFVAVNYLEPSQIGVVILAKLFIDYLENLSEQGMGTYVIKNAEISLSHKNCAYTINLLLASLLFISTHAAMYLFPNIIDSKVGEVLRYISITIILNGLYRMKVADLIRLERFKIVAIRNIVGVTISSVLAIALLIFGWGIEAIVIQHIVYISVCWFFTTRITGWQPSLAFNIKDFKKLYRFCWPIILDQQIAFFSRRTDELVIASMYGLTILGIYGVFKKFYLAISEVFVSPSYSVFLRQFSKFGRDLEKIEVFIKRITFGFFHITWFAPVFVSIYIGNLVILTIGPSYVPGVPLGVVFSLLIVIDMVQALHHSSYIVAGYPKIPLVANAIRLSVLVVSLIGFEEMGLLGIALSYLVREGVVMVVYYIFNKRKFSTGIASSNIFIYIIAACIGFISYSMPSMENYVFLFNIAIPIMFLVLIFTSLKKSSFVIFMRTGKI